MSISGKSDFEDFCCMHHSSQEIIDKYQIYLSGYEIVPLKIQSEKQLVAFYPYLTIMVISNKETGGTIVLSKESFIDTEEEDGLNSKLNIAKKYYRKCKRNKVEFNKDEALKKISLFSPPADYEIEIVNRVAEFGNKATIKGIHDPWHDQMRMKWYQLMLDKGWNEDVAYRWVYGWDRWFKK